MKPLMGLVSLKNLSSMMRTPKCFLFAFLGVLALIVVVHAQVPSGFISIDCGTPEGSNYTDATTGLYYISDAAFVDTGESKTISPEFNTNLLPQQFLKVRSFPRGAKNCYTLRPAQGKGNKYLIRARFMYGNYDAQNRVPVFDLHIGVDYWTTVTLDDSSTRSRWEIIHVPTTDYIYVCLINTGLGTPFISALELRRLNNSIYTTTSGSLKHFMRYDYGSTTDELVRYKDDVYDRMWNPSDMGNYTKTISTVSATESIAFNRFQPPSIVMSTAVAPLNASSPLAFWWMSDNSTEEFYIYMHFAEVEVLNRNQYRAFHIYLNGELFIDEPVVPDYLSTTTIYSTRSTDNSVCIVSMNKTENSTHPPIINAIEVYTVIKILHSHTYEQDVDAIVKIKLMYGVTRNWQGDPCAPKAYVWLGLDCSYDAFDPPRIISLNLSSSGLTGELASYISDLKMIQSLDLSNNNLTGQIPGFLTQLAFLKVLNLKGNNFNGSIPAELLAKSKEGSLSLSFDESESKSTNPCETNACKKKKNKVVLPVVASVVALSVLFIAIMAALWVVKRRKQVRKVDAETNQRDRSVKVKNQEFSYSEILSITKNFQRVVGKGGFGTVYHGYVGNCQVAVKMLSQSSIQGYKEFKAEANLLMSVHHKNLTSLVGYCNEGTNMGIIYEYMVNGDLEKHLSDRNPNVLSWEDRLRIAIDSAQGLEYLHHGCKPPIIHRDVKSTNILLDEKFYAKLADFGLSRVFPTGGRTHVSTVIAGTPGYLDPEYSTSNRLTDRSDVYSFGIVILEIITGRSALPKGRDKTHIIQWVSSMLENGDVRSIVDQRLQEDYDVNSVWKAIELAMACVSRNSTRRPSMNYVVMELKECLAMEIACHDTESRNSFGMKSMNFESGLNPLAR